MAKFSIAILGGSSIGQISEYQSASIDLAAALSSLDCEIICCGGKTGLIGTFIENYADPENIQAVILKQELESIDERIVNITISANTANRKETILAKSDLILALPGGIGTIDEILSYISTQKIGEHNKPIVLVDISDFYKPLLSLFENLVSSGFLKTQFLDTIISVASIKQVHDLTLQFKDEQSFSRL
ncbi:LOG family protein [Pseudomonas neuropathica]|jgi:uncharacterized protein (TIGR00730 family)|uniref:LOG family protein n=1 Tax=Pseudomonas neuropathica TaxID=2730425 RepID=UPI0034D4E1DE